VKVLHLVPLIGGLVEDVGAVGSLGGFAVVDDVGDEVVAGLLVLALVLGGENVAEIDVPVGGNEN
jgi:hypothetical protein